MHPEIAFETAADEPSGVRVVRHPEGHAVLVDERVRVVLLAGEAAPGEPSARAPGGVDISDDDEPEIPLGIVAPITASLARNVADDEQWMFWFRDQVAVARPWALGSGRWRLRMGPPPFLGWHPPHERALALRAALPSGDTRRVARGDALHPALIPLRRPPGRHSAAVLAHRSLLRDRRLPPVLLLHLTDLDSYVVLDGHSRLVAALAADQTPPFATLQALQ